MLPGSLIAWLNQNSKMPAIWRTSAGDGDALQVSKHWWRGQMGWHFRANTLRCNRAKDVMFYISIVISSIIPSINRICTHHKTAQITFSISQAKHLIIVNSSQELTKLKQSQLSWFLCACGKCFTACTTRSILHLQGLMIQGAESLEQFWMPSNQVNQN